MGSKTIRFEDIETVGQTDSIIVRIQGGGLGAWWAWDTTRLRAATPPKGYIIIKVKRAGSILKCFSAEDAVKLLDIFHAAGIPRQDYYYDFRWCMLMIPKLLPSS